MAEDKMVQGVQAVQGVQGTQESVTPTYPQFQSAADIDAYFTRQQEAAYERQRRQEEERLRRQQVAQAMGDLGHVLVDTIKASGGALVTPRDVTARYMQMDERNQKIYDNYIARMDAIRQRQYLNAQQALARKQHLDDVAAGQAFQRERDAAERTWKEEQNRIGLQAQKEREDARLQAQKDIAASHDQTNRDIANLKQEQRASRHVTIGGNILDYNKEDEKFVFGAMLHWLKEKGKVSEDRYAPEDIMTGVRKIPKTGEVVSLVTTTIPSLTPQEQADLYNYINHFNMKDSSAIVESDDEEDEFGNLFG